MIAIIGMMSNHIALLLLELYRNHEKRDNPEENTKHFNSILIQIQLVVLGKPVEYLLVSMDSAAV